MKFFFTLIRFLFYSFLVFYCLNALFFIVRLLLRRPLKHPGRESQKRPAKRFRREKIVDAEFEELDF